MLYENFIQSNNITSLLKFITVLIELELIKIKHNILGNCLTKYL